MSDLAARVASVLRGDPVRWQLLGVVQSLSLPDCWIAAGFVRNAVWDHLHGRCHSAPDGDIDVIWFDADRSDAEVDRDLEARLAQLAPGFAWSVKNQARMHTRNDDPPYSSATDAMRFWPETATAVAARRTSANGCEIAAPLGLDDLFALKLRAAGRFRAEKRPIFDARVSGKRWQARWPRLVST